MHPEFASVLGQSHLLMEPNKFREYVARAEQATPEAIAAAVAAYGQRPTGPDMVGDVAVISCCGPITYKPTWFSMFFGGSSIVEMRAQLQLALADPAVRVIVFRWDSPGGSVEMIAEFADEIFAARGTKPIVSITDTLCASAAYYLASQTDTIYASVSSMIGAVGVFVRHFSVAEALVKDGVKVTEIAYGDHKLDGSPYADLTPQAQAIIQEYVDELGIEFDTACARGRAVTRKVVAETFGQGQVFRGKQAISIGMADKVGTFSQVIGKLSKGRGGAVARATVATAITATTENQPPAAVAKAKATCSTCAEDCPCDEGECPDDCPTCDEGCACRPAAKAATDTPSAEASELSDADRDAINIAIALGTE